jgi:hypothetical protein
MLKPSNWFSSATFLLSRFWLEDSVSRKPNIFPFAAFDQTLLLFAFRMNRKPWSVFELATLLIRSFSPAEPKATDHRVRLFVLGYCPTPVSDAVCGLPPPLSATLRIALRVPVAVGLNRTLTVQTPPPASELPQVLPEIW